MNQFLEPAKRNFGKLVPVSEGLSSAICMCREVVRATAPGISKVVQHDVLSIVISFQLIATYLRQIFRPGVSQFARPLAVMGGLGVDTGQGVCPVRASWQARGIERFIGFRRSLLPMGWFRDSNACYKK